MELLLIIVIFFSILNYIGLAMHYSQIKKLKKGLKEVADQSEKDDARIDELEKTITRLQMRLDMMSHSHHN